MLGKAALWASLKDQNPHKRSLPVIRASTLQQTQFDTTPSPSNATTANPHSPTQASHPHSEFVFYHQFKCNTPARLFLQGHLS